MLNFAEGIPREISSVTRIQVKASAGFPAEDPDPDEPSGQDDTVLGARTYQICFTFGITLGKGVRG